MISPRDFAMDQTRAPTTGYCGLMIAKVYRSQTGKLLGAGNKEAAL
jgi:hypothetical protein